MMCWRHSPAQPISRAPSGLPVAAQGAHCGTGPGYEVSVVQVCLPVFWDSGLVDGLRRSFGVERQWVAP
jgi:hypothetical protein